LASDDAATLPFAADATGVRLTVRLTPRASRNGVDGIVVGADGRAVLRMRLAAPPVDGVANKALIGFLADALDVSKSAIEIRVGDTSPLKLLHVSGDAVKIIQCLKALIS
jgi:uncharacterized protein (TIGR00251 family)